LSASATTATTSGASATGCLNRAKTAAVGELEVGSDEITIIHTDRKTAYTSKAHNEIIKDSSAVRSCSRVGKPTDNPVDESLNTQ